MRKPAGICFLFWLLAAGWVDTSSGQESATLPNPDADRPLTVEFALSLALSNPVLDAAGEASLRAAEARLDAIGLLPNPELRMTHDERWTGETGREYALRFNPPNPWLNKALRDEGELGINLARIQADAIRWTAALEARKAFYQALHAKRLLALAEQAQETAQKKKTLYEMLLANGQATLPEVLEVRLQFLESGERLASAQRMGENAMNRLMARTGLPTGTDRLLAGDFETPAAGVEGLELDGLFLKHAAHHPLVSTLQLQADMVGARADQAKARNRLWFNFLQAGYSENSNWWEEEDWRFPAGIHVPIFDLQGKEAIAQQAEQDALAAQAEMLRQQTRANLAEALANLKAAARSLQEAGEISDAIAEEVRKTLAEDAAAPEPMLPPQSRFRLKEGLQRIDAAQLANDYRYQEAVLAIEAVLGERLEAVLETREK